MNEPIIPFWIVEATEAIDSSLFTGDAFDYVNPKGLERRTWLRGILARWERKMKEIEGSEEKYLEESSRPMGGTVLRGMLNISIQSIPHYQQRYDTCGDYFDASEGEGVVINVSELPSRREMLLVAIHELIEMALCEAEGVGFEEIDEFDREHEASLPKGDETEPGDRSDAPYYKQHQIASGIERILAAEMGVDWLTYSRHVEELNYSQPVEPINYDDDIPF